MSEELDLHELTADEYQEHISDAIDAASDQDKITWLTDGKKRIAAIVPVDVAEYHEQMIAGTLSTLVSPSSSPHDVVDDDVRGLHYRQDTCGLCSHIRTAHTLVSVIQREPRGELNCALCPDGKCRTPSARNDYDLEVAARAGLLSRRHR
jgi:hypothetical protein